MHAASTRHDEPQRTPRPFDADRDGLVVGEGSATLILESLEHARKRDAPILAEIVGFATNGDGRHILNPDPAVIASVQRAALRDAELQPADIDYVNAHATATEIGDVAESQATAEVFGGDTPISSLKGHMGHTLGACGALEAWTGIHMMNEGWLAPTLNLENIDPRCAPLDYLQQVREHPVRHFMTNNFAFGGVNTSLIFKRFED
jgi:3-oxoacyl-[acyl-carrier-protein] synthase II